MTDCCLNSALAETVCLCSIIWVIDPYLFNIYLCGIFMLYLAKKSLTCNLIAAMKNVASLQPYACRISAMSGGMVRNGEAPVTVGVINAICRYFLK